MTSIFQVQGKVLSWIVVVLSLAFSEAAAQRMTERWLTLNPLGESASSDSGWTFLKLAHTWGEFGPYRGSRDNDHAWSVKLGGLLELFRVDSDASLAFLSSIDLVSDPHNELRFNPRVMFWEEGFLYTIRSNDMFYQIGYYHRCKHDVDNLLPAPSYTIGVQRALMYGSVLGKALIPVSWNAPHMDALLTLRADVYTILQDDRLPRGTFNQPINLEQAITSIGATAHVRYPINEKSTGGFITSYLSLTFFGEEKGFTRRFRKLYKGTVHAGIAAGVTLQGAMHMRFGVSYEYLTDTGINPIPNNAHLVLFSITIINPQTMW